MKCPQCSKEAPDTNYKCSHCGAVLKEGIEPGQFRARSDSARTLKVSTLLLAILVIAGGVFFFISFNRSGEDHPGTAAQQPRAAIPDRQPNAPVHGVDAAETDPQEEWEDGQAADPEPVEDTAAAENPAMEMDVEEETASLESPPQPDGQEPALPHLKPRVTGHNPGEEVDLRDMAYPGRTTIFDFYSDYCPPCRQISPLLEALNRNRDDIVVIKIDINRPGVRGIDWRSPVARQHRLPSIPYFVIYDSHRRESHSGDSARERVFELLREEKIY